MKIFLLEDDYSLNKIIKDSLGKNGFFVDEFTNGIDSVSNILNSNYDIYILDINVPGFDGHKVLEIIREQKGNLPVDQTPFLSQLGAISMAGYLVADPKTQFCDTACKNKNLEVLKFLREKGFEWSTQAYNQVLTGGYDSNSKNPNIKRNTEIEMIKYLHENGCKWDSVVLGTAAVNGHIDCLKYIHQNGGELSTDTYFPSQMISSCVDSYASCTFDINNIETDTENIKQKHFECLKYLCENGLKLDKVCLFRAQETKNQELIDYVKSVYVDEPVPKKKKFGGLMDMFNGLMNKNQDDSDYDDLTIGSSESEDELEL